MLTEHIRPLTSLSCFSAARSSAAHLVPLFITAFASVTLKAYVLAPMVQRVIQDNLKPCSQAMFVFGWFGLVFCPSEVRSAGMLCLWEEK